MRSLAIVGSCGCHMVHAANMEDHSGLGDWDAAPIVAGNHVVVGHAGPYVPGLQEAVDGLAARLADVDSMHLVEDPWRRTSNDLDGSLHTRWTVRGSPPGR